MNTHNNFTKYNKIFKEWDADRTELAYREVYKYEPQEDEIFRACYLPRTKSQEPFYKARHSLPKFWFCSNKGTIITVKHGYPELIIGQFDRNDRAQVSFYSDKESHTVARETIVGLVFNDIVPCTEQAQQLIETKGIEAFKRRADFKCVELHHGNGYVYPTQKTSGREIFDNIAINCDNIQFVTRLEHFEIHRNRKAVA